MLPLVTVALIDEDSDLYSMVKSVHKWLLSIHPSPWSPSQQFLNSYLLLHTTKFGKSMRQHIRRFISNIGLEALRDMGVEKVCLPAFTCPSDALIRFVSDSSQIMHHVNIVLSKRYSSIPVGITPIFGHLYLGSGLDACNDKELKRLNIYRILNVAKDWHCHHYMEEGSPFTVRRVELLDNLNQELIGPLYQAIEIIEDAYRHNQKILVHCIVGKSRSVAIVLGYLLVQLKIPLIDAFLLVRDKRPIMCPNKKFMNDLACLELEHLGCTTLTVLDEPYQTQVSQPPPNKGVAKRPTELRRGDITAKRLMKEWRKRGTLGCFVPSEYNEKYTASFLDRVHSFLRYDESMIRRLEREGTNCEDTMTFLTPLLRQWFSREVVYDKGCALEIEGIY